MTALAPTLEAFFTRRLIIAPARSALRSRKQPRRSRDRSPPFLSTRPGCRPRSPGCMDLAPPAPDHLIPLVEPCLCLRRFGPGQRDPTGGTSPTPSVAPADPRGTLKRTSPLTTPAAALAYKPHSRPLRAESSHAGAGRSPGCSCPIAVVSEPGFVAGDVAPSASRRQRWCSTSIRSAAHARPHCAYARDATRPAKWRFRGSSPSEHLVGTALGRPHS